MKKLIFSFLAFFLIAFFPAEAASKKGWVLTQKSDMAEGESLLYISPSGAKSTFMGLTSIVRAGDNKILIVNDEKKEYSETTFEEWKKFAESMQKMAEFVQEEESTEKVGTEQVAGLKTERFLIKTKGGELKIPGMDPKALGLDESMMKMPDTQREVWVTQDIQISPTMAEFIQANTPQGKELPPEARGVVLRIVVNDEEGNPMTILDTVKCEQTSIDDSIFEAPAGYTKTEGVLGFPGGLEMPGETDEGNEG